MNTRKHKSGRNSGHFRHLQKARCSKRFSSSCGGTCASTRVNTASARRCSTEGVYMHDVASLLRLRRFKCAGSTVAHCKLNTEDCDVANSSGCVSRRTATSQLRASKQQATSIVRWDSCCEVYCSSSSSQIRIATADAPTKPTRTCVLQSRL